jgi:hypothetical protein
MKNAPSYRRYACPRLLLRLACALALSCVCVAACAQFGDMRVTGFEATHQPKKNNVHLAWKAEAVGSVMATGQFMLQKSPDGKKWFRLRIIPYQLYPNLAPETFRYDDLYMETYLHYRLVMRDPQGKAKVLGSAKLERIKALSDLQHEIILPVKKVYFTYTLEKDKTLLLRLYDRIGQQVFTARVPSGIKGPHDYLLDFARYPKGVYLAVFTQVEDNLTVGEQRIEWPGVAANAPAKTDTNRSNTQKADKGN